MLLIQDEAKLQALREQLGQLPAQEVIALDTEFMRIVTLKPQFALLQLRFKDQTVLVDALTPGIGNLCRDLLLSKSPILMFAAKEDIEVLAEAADIRDFDVSHLHDLQLMQAFIGGPWQQGLAGCVFDNFAISMKKDCTRSDWMARPLSHAQLEYAALDVAFLARLYQKLSVMLDPEHFAWYQDEMRQNVSEILEIQDPDTAYRSIHGAGVLKAHELWVLKHLCARRLRKARAENEALNRVITTSALCTIAQRMPLTKQGLASCGMKWGSVHAYGDEIIDWIKDIMSMPVQPIPKPYDFYAHFRNMRDPVRKLKHQLKQRAEAVGICPELVCARKFVHDFLFKHLQGQKSLLESGWRAKCLGELPIFKQDLSNYLEAEKRQPQA